MADNTINWGQGAVENTNGWGKAKSNSTNGFGAIYDSSYLGDTNISGGSSFTNTKSIVFDGVDDYVISTLDGTSLTDLSISMWFKIASVPPAAGSQNRTFFAWTNALSTFYHFVLLQFKKSSYQTNYRITFNNNQIESNTIAEADLTNWHHLALVRDNTSTTWTMYLDGGSQGTYNDGGSPSNQNRAAELYIGRNYPAGFDGNIDEVAVFNTALSSSDISDIYNSGTPNDLSSYSSLVSWYRMGDGDTYPTITDNKGTNNGTMTNMSSDDIVENVPGMTNLLLDEYSNAVHAYSLRKLSNNYYGDLIRVRRDSDNAEQNIGFDSNNELDQTALTTFVGSASGYVVEWYDQSGNGHTLERTSALTQPQIVNAGVVNQLNGKPVIIASNKLFTQKTTAATVTQPYTFVSVAKTFNQGGFFFNSQTTPRVAMFSSFTYWNYGQPTYTFAAPGFTNTQDLISGRFTGTQSKVYVDNGLRLGPGDATTGNYVMGNMGNNFQMQEYIVFDADYDSVISDINTSVNNFYSIY